MKQTQENATVLYQLHHSPPSILCQHAGQTYRVYLNGSSEMLSGGTTLPLPGNMFPSTLLKAKAYHFMLSNHRKIVLMVVFTLLLGMLQIILSSTEGGEYASRFILSFSFWMNMTLIVLFCLALIAFAASVFAKGVTIEIGKEPVKLLASGEISVAPDVIILSASEEETHEDFQERAIDARRALRPGQWLVVIPFRSPSALIQTTSNVDESTGGYTMLRSKPVMEPEFEHAAITPDDYAEAARTYGKETWVQYIDYCRAFAERFRVWSPASKLNSPNFDPLKVITSAACALFLLFLPMQVDAQKSRQVREYLGDVRYMQNVPAKGADVSFVFQRSVLSRTGNGRHAYGELLKAGAGFTDNEDQGKLIGITLDGRAVAPVGKKEPSKAQAAVSAVPVPDEVGDVKTSKWYESLPDSSELGRMKAEHLREKAAEWKSVQPVVDYYMWRFWAIMGFLLVLAGMLWVISKVTATDSIKGVYDIAFIGNAITGVHIVTKTVLFFILAFPTVVIFFSDAIRVYYTDHFSIVLVVKYAVICWIWYFAFERILPNSPQISSSRGGYPSNSGQRLIG